ncbi:MAG: hypothetical protein ACHP9T_08860 [Caulobacterales bacterium]
MSDFQVNAVTAPPPIAAVRQVEPPKPPKAQSDHEPANPATSSRGPAVVLSGAVAQGAERHGRQPPADGPPTGQHVNQVI